MRRATLVLALLLWPTLAAAAPDAGTLINEAIKALGTTSYEGEMKFISHLEGGKEREVRVYHRAPDLYRVEMLKAGQPTKEYFLETASELLLVSPAKPLTVLPQRQFSINDAMTVKFLRDLRVTPGLSVLDGQVGDQSVYVLRKGLSQSMPWEVTVGLDRKTYFPLFLLVNDAYGSARVYYELRSISYIGKDKLDSRLPLSLFAVDGAERKSLPRRPSSAHDMLPANLREQPLPLYPRWLPSNYRLEAVSVLRCPRGVKPQDCALVYQLEAYGPGLSDMVSIFQMREDDAADGVKRLGLDKDAPVYLTTRGDWVIAVFGDLDRKQLEKIAGQLSDEPDKVRKLLVQTLARDSIMEDAFTTSH